MEQPPRTVWILGSGFSKSLGGPLLEDLLSDATNALVGATYPDNTWLKDPLTHAVRNVFYHHGPVPRGPNPNRLWSDAEAFLDYVDAAAQSGGDSAPVDPEFALNCPGDEIGIATPGPSKQISTKELVHVWDGALDWIRKASVIVFVGYRFPPSDAEAREKLLDAIRENKSRRLELHIVLGPRQQADDVVRLQQLLEYTAGWQAGRKRDDVMTADNAYWVVTHALYAEDFFTVWSRRLLRPVASHGFR